MMRFSQDVTELNRQLPEFLRLGKPDKHLSLALQQFSPRPSNSSKIISPYFYIGGTVVV